MKVEGKADSFRALCSNLQHLKHKGEGLVTVFVRAGRVTSLAHHDNPGSKKVILWFLAMGRQATKKDKRQYSKRKMFSWEEEQEEML